MLNSIPLDTIFNLNAEITCYTQHKLDLIDQLENRHVDAFAVFHRGYLLVQHLDPQLPQLQQLTDALQEPVY